MAFGIDYSFGGGLSAAEMKSHGVTFVARYLDYLPNGKVISKAEFDNIIHGGMAVVLVWEGTGKDCIRGHAGGVADAHEAERQANALGAPGTIIYFAPCDYDAPPGDQAMIDAYVQGAASVLGHGRTGMYGGYWPLSRALTAGACAWGWQTLAWSGGLWDSRAVMRQGLGISVGGVQADVDTEVKGHDALVDDYGQWPRPGPPPPPVPITAPTLMQADGRQSLRVAVHAHATTVQRALWLMANNKPAGSFGWLQRPYVEAGDWNAPMPQGMTYWVG